MSELRSLCELSARIGSNPLLVQGSGGNTSLKVADRLWVKASGTWLSDATRRRIFVPLSLAAARSALVAGDERALAGAVAPDEDGSDLRPSIETALHALMPHRVVVHAHAVNSMVTSVLANGRDRAARCLDGGARWAWVDYRRPGQPLADAVAHALECEPDVLLLQNHGVVVGAQSSEEAERRLNDVERRLELPERSLPAPDPHRHARGATGAYEPLAAASGLAVDPELAAVFSTVCFIPDQVVFLGGVVPMGAENETADAVAARAMRLSGIAPPLVLVAGAGAYGARGRSEGAECLIIALLEMGRRLPRHTRVTGLSERAIAELQGWDAEAHRRRLDRERG